MLVGRCLAYGQGVTLWPLAEMLKTEAGVLETDPSDEASAKIATLVEMSIEPELAREPSRTRRPWPRRWGCGCPATRSRRSIRASSTASSSGAWRALLASMATSRPSRRRRRGPALGRPDDARRPRRARRAARRPDPLPLHRASRPAPLASRLGRRASELQLAAARPAEQRQRARGWSRSFPASTTLPDGVRRLILERSGGNPFFLEEIVRHLINDGRLVWEGDRWRAAPGSTRWRFRTTSRPSSSPGSTCWRRTRGEVAQRAAVVGRVFWDGALALSRGSTISTRRCGHFAAESSCSSGSSSSIPAKRSTCSSTSSSATSPTRACRGRSEAAPTRRRRRGSRRRAASGRASWRSCSRTTTTPRSRSCARTSSGGAPAGISSSPRRTRTAGSPSSKASASRCGPSSSPRAGPSGWRRSRRSATSTTSRSSAMPRGARTARRSGSSRIAIPRSRVSPGKPRCSAVLAGSAPCTSFPKIDDGHRMSSTQGCARRRRTAGSARCCSSTEASCSSSARHRRDDEADAAVREAVAAAEELDDADLLSAALDLRAVERDRRVAVTATRTGRHCRRTELVPRMTDVKEIGDSYAMAARSAHHLGRYREAEAHASACIERSREIDSGSYLHGLTWRVAARFTLGDWDGALADQAELERVAGAGSAESCRPPTRWRGIHARRALPRAARRARRVAIDTSRSALRYFDQRMRPPGAHDLGSPGVRSRSRLRGEGASTRRSRSSRSCRGARSAGVTLEALCEIAAARERWDEAAGLVAAAREEAEVGEQLSLPLFADRLEGRAAGAGGDMVTAAWLLDRSARRVRRARGPLGGGVVAPPAGRGGRRQRRRAAERSSLPRSPSSSGSDPCGRPSGARVYSRQSDGPMMTHPQMTSLACVTAVTDLRSDRARRAAVMRWPRVGFRWARVRERRALSSLRVSISLRGPETSG